MNFALRLKELRETKHISQKQLAIDLGVGVGSVGMWESSDRTPPAKKLKVIADYFGVSVDYLLGAEITAEEYAAGARETVKVNITPLEDDLLYAFRQVGKLRGEAAQRAIVEMIEKML